MAGNAAGDAFQDFFADMWKKFYSGDIPPDSDTLILTFNYNNIIKFVYYKGTMGHSVPHGKFLRIKFGKIVDIDLSHSDDNDDIVEEIKDAQQQIEYVKSQTPNYHKFFNGPKFGNMNMIAGFSGYEFK